MPSPSRTVAGLLHRVPAPLIFMTAGLSGYVGAGLAVSLFAVAPATTVAWWRITVGALVLLAWRRPWRRTWTRRALLTAAAFGVATATMNVIFYAAIARLPMGTAVSLEFLGPVTVAVTTGRGWRPRAAAVIALAGVVSISGLGVDLSDAVQRAGALAALAAGAAWAAYILTGRRVAAAGADMDALSVSAAVGSLVYAPLALPTAGRALTGPGSVALVVGVGVMSTVIPYVLDQVTLGRLRSATFSLLSSLMPATSLLVGLVMLRQVPTVGEVLGLVLVSTAVALAGG